MKETILELAGDNQEHMSEVKIPDQFCLAFADLLIENIINDVKMWEKDSRNHISYMLRIKYAS